jgi:tripartite-type tricarboxylate transporter receptor subunit TctC
MAMKRMLAAAVMAAAVSGAGAQGYPAKPIRMLVPQTPGSGVDLILRRSSEDLRSRLGQPIVIENHPGANQVVAADMCAKAAPDGYTLCTVSMDTTSINPLLMSNLPYDPKDLKPIVNLYTILGGLYTKPSLAATSAAELRSLAGAKRGSLNWAHLGHNTITDLSRLWLEDKWNVTFAGIPYKGGPQIFTALSSGEVDVTWQGVYGAIGLMKDRKVKLLAVSGSKRLPQYPDVPTLKELGLDELPSASSWWGVFGQAAMPQAVVTRINQEYVRVFREPKFVEFLDSLVTEGTTGTPEEFAAVIRRTDTMVTQLIKQFNIPKH